MEEPAGPPVPGTPRVLLVDDNPVNLMALAAMLDAVEVELVERDSGAGALAAIWENPDFAVVLLDVQMPGMDGYQVAEAIPEAASGQEIPVVFVTAVGTEPDQMRRGYESGAVDYLVKPLAAYLVRSKVGVFARMWRDRRSLDLMNFRLEEEVRTRRAAESELREQRDRVARLLRRRTEDLERSNRELEALGEQASHDLRTPLRTIAGFATALAEDLDAGLVDEAGFYLERIRRGAARMDRLVDGLVEFAQSGSSRDLTPVSIEALAGEVLEELSDDLTEAGAEVEVVRGLPTVLGHHGQLHRVLHHLVGNALRYSAPERAPRIAIRPLGPGGFEVRDNGRGFPPEEAEAIFQPFNRLDGERADGAGMGLNVCRKIVRGHGGDIAAEGHPGRGAAFQVSLRTVGS